MDEKKWNKHEAKRVFDEVLYKLAINIDKWVFVEVSVYDNPVVISVNYSNRALQNINLRTELSLHDNKWVPEFFEIGE